MEAIEGTALSPKEYLELSRAYVVRVRTVWPRVGLPVSYGRVEGRESGEVLAYLSWDAAREEWAIFAPDDATEEAERAFAC